MSIGLLGEIFAVGDDGTRIGLGTPKQRTVFALLAAEAGRVVTVDQLVDELWPQGPPRSAVANVRTYAANLRRELAKTAGGSIRLEPAGRGYVLRAERRAVDAHLFVQELAAGRAAAAGGGLADAVGCLQRAIALWRGQPFADVACADALTAKRCAWEDELAMAVEERAALHVRLGEPARAVSDLRAHVRANPLRERGWELLMRALHETGDTAGALAAFADARRAIVERLGIEPGQQLRTLQETILRGCATPPAATAPPRPAQLPADIRSFVGRAAELAELDRLLGERGAPAGIVAICGGAGMGKTSLAIHWAHRTMARFPDGQLYVNLRGYDPGGVPLSPDQALRAFLDALGVPPGRVPADRDAAVGLYRTLLAGRRILLVLDNAHDAEQVRPLLPTADCVALVTSRRELLGMVATDGAQPLTLDLPSAAEAARLLGERVGRERAAAQPAAMAALVSRCARLPLALAIVAARVAARPGRSLADFAAELSRDGLGPFDGGEPVADLRSVFSWSYRQLGPDATRMFRLLGLHPGPDLTVAAAASLAGVPVEVARRAIVELVAAQLLAESAPGRYGAHDLLRAYAGELAAETDESARGQASARMLAHYLHTAYAADRLLEPTREAIVLDPPVAGTQPEPMPSARAAQAWFAAELTVLDGLLGRAGSGGDEGRWDTGIWQLVWCMADFLQFSGRWDAWAASQAVAVAAAERLGDAGKVAQAHRVLARALIRLGRHAEAEAHFLRAARGYRRARDSGGEALVHLGQAWLAQERGDHRAAIRHATRALAHYERVGDRARRAEALNSAGYGHAYLGQYAEALANCGQALELYRQLGDRFGQAYTWDSLGFAHSVVGDHRAAVASYGSALALMPEVNDPKFVAELLVRHGDAHHAAGDRRAAGASWRRALAILVRLNHPDAGAVRVRLGPS